MTSGGCPSLCMRSVWIVASTGTSRQSNELAGLLQQGADPAPEALGAGAPVRDQPGAAGSAADPERHPAAARRGRQRPRRAQAGAAAPEQRLLPRPPPGHGLQCAGRLGVPRHGACPCRPDSLPDECAALSEESSAAGLPHWDTQSPLRVPAVRQPSEGFDRVLTISAFLGWLLWTLNCNPTKLCAK